MIWELSQSDRKQFGATRLEVAGELFHEPPSVFLVWQGLARVSPLRELTQVVQESSQAEHFF